MRLPPWAAQAIRNGVADVARKASDPETIKKVRQQATELLRDLPDNASRSFDNASKSIDAIVKTASDTARDAFDQGRATILRWSEREHDIASVCYNASGTLLHRYGSGVPVSDRVLQLGADLLRGDCLNENADRQIADSLTRQLDLHHHRLLVATNLDAAVRSIASLIDRSDQSPREIIIHRAHAVRLPSGIPLPDLFDGHDVKQCGGVDSVVPEDFRCNDHSIIVMADDGKQPLEPIEFPGSSPIRIAVLPTATIDSQFDNVPSVKSLLKSGFDVVITAGGTLTGGPSAGLIAGKTSLLESIESSVLWNFAAAHRSIAAMTLASMTNPSGPLQVLMETGEENLRSRSERMATRLTASEEIATCQIGNAPAVLVDGKRWSLPSRQLRLRHVNKSSETWAAELLDASPALITSVDGEDLLVDLRWIPASSDSVVTEIIAPPSSSSTTLP
ncbi:hypothetical protein [Roseiconus lacunae]|uniref:hypothetical protein n=1 Tax=Roseiconus lacunae TaxID=2605694 RepID=UPI0011F37702|nr:hypothetical protein [Roseiconus lacunae]